ncbi:esterase-like [Canna indica]|uniref:Esterase-like n=1 Tax=Canna indica TaxID=4628 RepID=A0AAQ3KT53_9LILI|nr:esterase-like [Canna indica]
MSQHLEPKETDGATEAGKSRRISCISSTSPLAGSGSMSIWTKALRVAAAAGEAMGGGMIWKGLGLPYLSAYLNSVGTNFSHGANFATAGSTIRAQNTTLRQAGFSPFSLDVQTWEFAQFKPRSQSFVKQGLFKDQLPKEEYFSQALYTFDIGQNDLTAAYFSNMTTEEVKAVIPDILDKFTIDIQSIYWQGGRYFWIHNTGPFGCLPYVLDRLTLRAPDVDEVGCGSPFNEVAQLFNQKLKEVVDQLKKDLPLAVFTYVDIYSLKYELISHAHMYGFDNALLTCCGHGGKYNYNANFGCGSTRMVNNTETWEFAQFKPRSQSFVKQGLFKDQLPKEEYFSQALYTFDIGQNDLTAAYFSNMTTEEVKAVIPDILDKFTIDIQSIYWQGGRYFWIHNTGPFGCLPYVLDRLTLRAPDVDRVGCGSPFNEVAQLFNQKLKEVVDQLKKDLPLAVFTYVDIYSLKYELISHAHLYGFDNALLTCCGHGGKYNYNANFGCGSTRMVNNTEVLVGKSCKNPSRRIIWDGVHFTQAANKWIFDHIVGGKFSYPPTPLKMACKKN